MSTVHTAMLGLGAVQVETSNCILLHGTGVGSTSFVVPTGAVSSFCGISAVAPHRKSAEMGQGIRDGIWTDQQSMLCSHVLRGCQCRRVRRANPVAAPRSGWHDVHPWVIRSRPPAMLGRVGHGPSVDTSRGRAYLVLLPAVRQIQSEILVYS